MRSSSQFGRAFVVALLVASATLFVGCPGSSGASDEYAAASVQYKLESDRYVQAGDAIDAAHKRGRVTAEQWSRFLRDAAAQRAADVFVADDLRAWRDTGVKPPTFEAHAQALRDAQHKVIALSDEVTR
jgi:hypothetical protein